MKDTQKANGERFKEQREALGLSIIKLSEILDVHRNTVANYEKGLPIPSNVLLGLDELQFDILYLVTGRRGFVPIKFMGQVVPILKAESSADAQNIVQKIIEPIVPAAPVSDLWAMHAQAVKAALIKSGAVEGQDFNMLDIFKLVQPLVVKET